MDLALTYELYQTLKDDNISFIYQGDFSGHISATMLDLIEHNLESKFSKIRNKISFLMIESLQNITRHGGSVEVRELEANPGFFLTRNIGHTFHIISGNLIENKNIAPLKEKLNQVNSLDKKGLKELYFDVISNSGLSEKGGAGLGLIEMVRKSKQKLDFDFVKVNNEASFFYLQLRLKGIDDKDSNLSEEEISLKEAIHWHRELSKQKIFVVHKGNYNRKAIRPVLSMVENNIELQAGKKQKITFHLLVEILQNISKHSYISDGKREGIFIMGMENDHFIITTGNFIESGKAEKLAQALDMLNSMSKKELDEFYRSQLRDGVSSSRPSAGLGLIDIARDSSEKIHYSLTPAYNGISFFSLKVCI